MKNFSELIQKRRSMRKFTEEELSQEEVVSLLRAGLMAPSSKGSTCWQFLAVDDKHLLAQLSECKTVGASFLKEAALAIVVLADITVSDVWIEDASVASAYIQLQAEDLGQGSCWVQLRNRFTRDGEPSDAYVHELLNLPSEIQPLSIIALGHKGMERKPFNEDNLQWEKVHLNTYGGNER